MTKISEIIEKKIREKLENLVVLLVKMKMNEREKQEEQSSAERKLV